MNENLPQIDKVEIKENQVEEHITIADEIKIENEKSEEVITKNLANNVTKSDSVEFENVQIEIKKPKKSVRFNKVDLFEFDRSQGHQSIPASDTEKNSITLGMSFLHASNETFQNQEEFLIYKRKCDLEKLELFLKKNEYLNDNSGENDLMRLIEDPNLEKIKEVLNKREFYETNIEEDLGISADIICPILNLNERLEKLKEFGFTKDNIDNSESEEINLIRESRKVCGCSCSKMNMICGENGDLCSCFANGINCQLDRLKYPCGCSLKRCKNQFGMKRFNPKSVLDHYKLILHSQNKKSDEDSIETNNKKKNSNNKKKKRKTKTIIRSPKRRKYDQLENIDTEIEIIYEDIK